MWSTGQKKKNPKQRVCVVHALNAGPEKLIRQQFRRILPNIQRQD